MEEKVMLEFFYEKPILTIAVIVLCLIEIDFVGRLDQRLGEIMSMQMVWPIIFFANLVIALGISHFINSVFQCNKKQI
jgi:hypothetical protein